MAPTFGEIFSQIEDRYALPVAFLLLFGFGGILAAMLNNIFAAIYLLLFPSVDPDWVLVCRMPIFAAIQENVTTLLAPSVLFAWFAMKRGYANNISEYALFLGVLAGFTVGTLEALSKMLDHLAFIPTALPPVLGHILYGGVLVSTVFYLYDRSDTRKYLLVALSFSVTVSLHVIWNTEIVFMLAGGNPC